MNWSYACGRKSVNRVRVYERPEGAGIYVDYTVDGKRTHKSLRSVVGRPVIDRDEAEAIAEGMAEKIAQGLMGAYRFIDAVDLGHELSIHELATVEPAELRKVLLPPRPLRGVYILYFKGEVVYIGQSSDVLGRLYHHRMQLPLRWDEVAFLEFRNREERLVAERELIERFTPIGNRHTGGNGKSPASEDAP